MHWTSWLCLKRLPFVFLGASRTACATTSLTRVESKTIGYYLCCIPLLIYSSCHPSKKLLARLPLRHCLAARLWFPFRQEAVWILSTTESMEFWQRTLQLKH